MFNRVMALRRARKFAVAAANALENAATILQNQGEDRGAASYAAMAEGVKKLAENTK